jgi:hypothetical protein
MRDQKGHLMMTNESNYKSEITILNLHKSRNTVNKIQQKWQRKKANLHSKVDLKHISQYLID